MGHLTSIILLYCISALYGISNGCTIEGVNLWDIPVAASILDTYRGVVLDRATSDIEGMIVNHGNRLNGGPYVDVVHSNSRLIITTNDLYPDYERYETLDSMSITINFSCTNGNNRNLVVIINVQDTNNNAPIFIPNDEFECVIATPVPPGFIVTGCTDGITVQDIDLTTRRIDFAIEDNSLFEIAYDASLSTRPKEFKAVLRTKTLIRTIPEPITLRISATDVDETNDPPITTHATIRIQSDAEFVYPEEPVFSQTFYMATYSRNHELAHEPISLRQGFDDDVIFDLEGEHANNFNVINNGNQISIRVREPLPADVMLENQILLIVKAERTYTSGASATIIVQLPEVIQLEFERAHYSGIIVDNQLQLPELRLSQGYGGLINASITSDHSRYFTPTVEGNTVSIAMSQLTENVILENNFIYLQVVASTDHSVASTIVTLEIVKDDHVTPVFGRTLYSGTYSPSTGLVIEPILIVNGFDETVNIELDGDHVNLFNYVQNGPNINLRSSPLPPDLFSEQQILLTIKATKPRTVGASAAIVISLPEARILDFEEPSYKGSLREGVLTLETIVLSNGYDDNVRFTITGEYGNYFEVSNVQNRVNLRLRRPLPSNVITDNSFILLTLNAEGLNAVTASATILLEIIKEDTSTPLFSRNIYYATYRGTNEIDMENNIMLRQGYDSSVTFRIVGEHSQYFRVTNDGNNVLLSIRSAIPSDVIFREKVLYINILANKELTVGANAALLIRFPAELTEPTQMRFSEHTYTGSIENNQLSMETITLSVGYEAGTDFFLTGDYADNFRITSENNIVSVFIPNPLPAAIIEDNDLIILEIEARRERAVSVWTSVVIEVVRPVIEMPVFSEAYYTGTYVKNTGLLFEDQISLSSGYDETVTFDIEGEFASLFIVNQNKNLVTLTINNSIPQDIIKNNDRLLFTMIANKPNSKSANTAIVIDIQREITPELVLLGFEKVTYVGSLENNAVTVDPIVLSEGFTSSVTFTLHGDLERYFRLTPAGRIVTISLQNPIPEAAMPANGIIVLEVQASAPGAITAHTTVVLTVVTDSEVAPIVELVFSAAHYTGTYTEVGGLVFTTPISLSQGYDTTVQFDLEGDNSQWFGLTRSQNSATLTLANAIPAAVIANNRNLIFSVIARRPGSADARSTIVIALSDEYTDGMSLLGFERVTYVGTLENNAVTVDPIVLSEGFTSSVTFTLHGDLERYFRLTPAGRIVTISLQNPIPEAAMPANGIIVLEVQASAPGAITAHTTVVLTVVTDSEVAPIVELVFSAAHYTGTYTEVGGLVFTTPISLSQGYDTTVQFDLEGDNSQWFGLTRSQNSATLTLANAIPAAVIANNRNLIFSVIARRPGSADARSTIVIALSDEYTDGMSLLGFERVTYVGTLENNAVTVDPIVLSEGFTSSVTFTLHGDLERYFRLTPAGRIVTISLQNPIPEAAMPANGIIVLEVQASAPGAITAHTTVVLTVVTDSEVAPIVELVFSAAHYTGTYTEVGGLVFTTPISLSQGYDTTVQFDLEGDNSQWFGLTRSQNSATLTLANAIPAAVIANNRNLIFSVIARRPGSADARSTIVIALSDEYTDGMSLLGFERVTYVGTLENNAVTVDPIVLSEGFTSSVTFTLHGDLERYFRLTPAGRIVTISLQNPIPEAAMPANGIIVLEVQASAPGAITAHTTVVLTVVTDSEVAPIVELVFSAAHYTGTYTEVGGLVFTTPISLSQGYDTTVQFDLEGDNSQWFGLTRSQNSATLTLANAIPAAVIANNRNLIFSVIARRPGSADARSTIVIALSDEYTDGMSLLGFERVTYVGTLENNAVTVDPIVLSEGFTSSVTFTLHGDLERYFRLTPAGRIVTISLQNPIPEAAMPANGIIVLEVQASAPGAITAHTTVVLTVVTDSEVAPIVELVFSAAHYTGTYTEVGGLVFTTPISLSQGYDTTVQFDLEGDNSQWFGLTRSQNSATLTLANAIPAAVIANNRNLIFSVIARRPGSTDARSTIVIALSDEYTDGMSLLGFERVTYVGTLENNAVTVDPIVLSEGFTSSVTFTLHGDLERYFRLTPAGRIVTISLQNPIPEAAMPANGIIVLEVQASAPGAITAHTTVVLTVVTDSEVAPIVELVFSAAHYTGTYTEVGGLVFTTPISLSQGYDTTVQFDLEGDNSQWFGLTRSQNSATLTLANAIPAAVIANNRNLIFSVIARRPGSADARSTIVIALSDEYTDGMSLLGFERVTYVGTLENNAVTVDPIVLSEGFTSSVTFTLHGDLERYFRLTPAGRIVTISLQNPIPEAAMPANGIIVLEVQASAPGAITAHTTVVLTVVTDSEVAPIVELVFSAAHYTGTYTEVGGLVFTTPISLSQGYDTTVQFDLEGDNSQWFGLTRSQNSATLTLANAIPAAVIANNRNLIFSVIARRPGSTDARSTIVIALSDEYTDGMSLLGFERVTYVGTLENNAVTVDPIVLSEGFTSSVTFTLHGDLERYFRLTPAGRIVTISLQNPIPEAAMPANGIIVLEVQASAPGAITAHTTVVLTVVTDSEVAPIVELVFSAAHYTGTYTEVGGLVFTTPISLSQGYDTTVQFDLEGDNSQWFGLTRSQNSATLTLANAIPAAVIANNRNLIFSVIARRPGSADARSTIVIALSDEYTDGMSLLGFERVTYVGTLENNAVTVDPIVLSEGFTSSVTFTLHGDLERYFRLTPAGRIVTISLQNPIPEAAMPANGIIVLEVQASAPGAITAHTTVVLTVVTDSEVAPIVELVFSAAHYTGTYTEVGGLVFTTPISLSQGYDTTVQFDLEGDNSQWFGLTRSQNSATLTLANAIPAAVIANNRNLIFSVIARRPGSADARSTIVIALSDEYTDGMSLLGFERVTYVGTLENNAVTVDPIVLSEGFTSSVTFTLHGDLERYFRLTPAGRIVTISLQNPIPEAAMPANGIIVLEVQASAPGAITAHTTVVLTVVTDSEVAPIVELVFSAAHYTGTYTEVGGLVFTTPISLSQGYDTTVQFDLEGDNSQWFGLTRSQNSATLTLANAIPAAVIANNRNLIFSVIARRPGSADARSTIVIALSDEYTDGMSLLGFERVTYVGTLENNAVTVDPIVLSEGFTSSVTFTLHGDLERYFRLTPAGRIVTISLQNPIPEAAMPANGIIVLEVQASAPGAITAHTTVVLTVVTDSEVAPIVELVFSAAHYTGTYTEVGGLVFTTPISLSQGYDTTVQFDLEGDNSQWFGLTRSQNSATLTLANAIPAAVIANNRNLIFSVIARRPGSADARSTIVIALSDEYTDGMSLLGFERVTYVGTLENNAVTVDPIVLSEGFTSSVTFTLHGDLERYFRLTPAGRIVTISLQNPIPEAAMPANGIIVLEVQASAPGAITAHTTVVLTVVTDSEVAPIVELVFSAAHYTGTYTEVGGLVFTTPISLSQGYDTTVQFDLEGDNSQWFGLTRSQNSATLTLANAIPAAVIANNRNLIFSVIARRPGSTDARSTIVIALSDEYTDGMSLLGFERVTYVGTLENNAVTVDPIVLSEGFTSSVTFTLHGDLERYFRLTPAGRIVTISLQNPIPEAAMPANGIIVLEVQASAPGAITAHTTVVLTVVTDSEVAPIVELVFSAAHYTGTYTEVGGLVFTTPISLSQGYDTTVQFDLEGDNSQWFGLTRSQNSATLTLANAIPAAVIANNRNLIFSVIARRPGSTDARSTIVIALSDEYTDGMSLLGFERVTYVGTLENNAVTVDPIVLSEGFTSSVTFTLHGDLERYFRLTPAGRIVTISLQNPIPEAAMPANGIIVLEVQASAPGAITAHTTVVLTVVTDSEVAPIVELVFSAAHYTGTYTEVGGLVFTTPISLSQGYDTTVQFDLEGDNSQWFGLTRSQNSATLTLANAIPAAVIANNRNLIFSVIARRPGSTDARSTIVIALSDEYTDGMSLLGFERVTYVGTLENNAVTVDPIVLSEGFTSSVTFTLHGDLERYFRLTPAGRIVTISLQNPIPEAAMPANGIIVLEVQASAPGAITAHTTVVLTVVTDSEVAPIVELVFSAAHYTGTYTEVGGLVFTTPISLSQGYDTTVQFDLEGDNSQWFGLTRSQNSATLTLANAIPAAVIANNRNLIFSVIARRPGSADARSTIVIALSDEYTDGMSLLGFERVTYVGTLENNAVTVDPIVLSEGFTSSVTFTLHGDLERYFRLTPAGRIVTISLQNPIPEAAMPANGIIVLEVQASAPGAITAHTTVVLTVVTDSEVAPIVELVFSAAHYTGTYTEVGGLVFTTPISLSQGYDTTVQFDLEGDNSQWFRLTRSQNSATLTLANAIPAAVIANNQNLIFSVVARRPGSADARAVIVISLHGDANIELDVRFDRILYDGLLRNDVVLHETILLEGNSDKNIEILGEYSSLFVARVSDGEVFVRRSNMGTLPNVNHMALELQISAARAVLVLTVERSDAEPPLPVVTFSSPSYTLSVDNTQTGFIGRVVATSDNGEAVRYSITSNDQLSDRLSINSNGEIHLSAPAPSGVYSAIVIATTVFTQARAEATIHITVIRATTCGNDNRVLPPLIILSRDEEVAHENLVVLNETEHPGCLFTLTNRWPANQSWLYIDEAGLHTEAIDREHESIAFMALSQIQVELTLHCDDENTRTKRSLAARPEWLGPYDYGTSEWILTDTISYNPRRSLVNLIVNDINDNRPIFIGKENEPIAVGYPIDNLVETVVPRSLAELQATDADIGINAALIYWSTEEVISVAPTSGFVHVRNGANLENNTRLVIHATDRRGTGLSGSIEILVKLLDIENILVLTVRDAFLDDENNILAELSTALGYDVKALRSTVIPDGAQTNRDDSTRKQRNTQVTGSSLQLYIYGMVEREPVSVNILAADLNNNAIAAVTVASVVSLEDYLEGREVCVIPGRDTGLLVATILLSILLFILIVLIAVWFILKRRKKVDNYDQFSDQNSLASRSESVGSPPKIIIAPKPRLNIDEIKKSERRLQDMLQAPIPEPEVRPATSRSEFPPESIIDMSLIDSPAPVVTVIQSIDKLKDATDESDNDEFGEVPTARRKSVVTFNENVEKIIHVEDNDNLSAEPDYEIYKL